MTIKNIIVLLYALVVFQNIFSQNTSVKDSIIDYLKENVKNLDKIEGIWELNVLNTLYQNDTIIGQRYDEKLSEWAIIRENETLFKVIDIGQGAILADFEASFEKVSAKDIYFYQCHFKNLDWIKMSIAEFWNDGIIHYSYYVSKPFMEQEYGSDYNPFLLLHWEFYWVKKNLKL